MASSSSPLTPTSALPSALSERTWSSGLSSGTGQPRNPVSLRLYKVLSTHYDDEDTRRAIETLSDYFAPPPASTSKVQVKGEEQQKEKENEKASAAALPFVEGTRGESAARARKHLRRDMELKLAEGSRKFLDALGEVDAKLQDVQKNVGKMRMACDDAETQLALTGESSKVLLERAGNLRDERHEVEDKQTIISLFLGRFTLNEKEAETITSRDVPLGPKFFETMDKTERIREDCMVLMAAEDGPTKAGLDIMASTSSYLEQGYDKLLRYCSNEFRTVGRDLHLEVNPLLRMAIARLRKRPELISEVLATLSETRQATLSSSFLTALTRGGPSGYPRPIELHAHDPIRYVGDMLAWVHQAIAAEREFLESLFGVGSDNRMVGSVRQFEKGEEQDMMRGLMDSAVGRLVGPLRNRVQQTMRSQESSIVSYKIANLLQFYLVTMKRTIGEDAALSIALKEITDGSYKIFYDSISAQSAALTRTPFDVNDPSISLPAALLDYAQILREIMGVYQSSLLGGEEDSEKIEGFGKVLDVTIDPLVTMCIEGAKEKKKLRPKWDAEVFVVNALEWILSVLKPFDFTSAKCEEVEELLDERVNALTTEHFVSLMRSAGIIQLAETFKNHRGDEPLSRIPGAQQGDIQRALRAFAQWLSSSEVVHSDRLSHLSTQKLHREIHHDALKRLAKVYRLISERVRDPQNRYEGAETLLGSERPFGKSYLLGQILGIGEEEEEESEDDDDDDDEEESEESEE